MSVKDEISKTIEVLKKLRKFKSQKDIALHLEYNVSYFSRAINEKEIPIDLEEKFFSVFPKSVYLSQYDSLFSTDNIFDEPYTPEPKPEKKSEDLKQLENIKSQNGKSKNSNEGKVLNNDDVVKIKTFIIPIKGFAGLKNAFYDDQYITENFDETTTDVPHYLYSPISYRIQSTGNSMPKSIPDGSWVTGVPVPEMMWLTYKFKQDKIYILFHPYRGILFKHVKNISEHEIMLCSENEDKEEYPDEKFKINEFRKILLAIKVERFI